MGKRRSQRRGTRVASSPIASASVRRNQRPTMCQRLNHSGPFSNQLGCRGSCLCRTRSAAPRAGCRADRPGSRSPRPSTPAGSGSIGWAVPDVGTHSTIGFSRDSIMERPKEQRERQICDLRWLRIKQNHADLCGLRQPPRQPGLWQDSVRGARSSSWLALARRPPRKKRSSRPNP